eukprot:1158931-Pelagomonas_calceolata.AAC.1
MLQQQLIDTRSAVETGSRWREGTQTVYMLPLPNQLEASKQQHRLDGIIYTPHTLEPLKELGLDSDRATKLALKLHARSVQCAYKLASTRRTLEKTSFNPHHQDQARDTAGTLLIPLICSSLSGEDLQCLGFSGLLVYHLIHDEDGMAQALRHATYSAILNTEALLLSCSSLLGMVRSHFKKFSIGTSPAWRKVDYVNMLVPSECRKALPTPLSRLIVRLPD